MSAIQPDEGAFARGFPDRPFAVAHTCAGDPRFSLDALVALSAQLPPDRIEYNTGRVAVDQDPDAVAPTGLTVAQTLRSIETAGSWVVLKNVELVPAYAELLASCLGSVAALTEPRVGPALDAEAFVFVSSPGSVTPFHVDPEHNFLLQVRGTKTVRIWDPTDRVVVSDAQLEARCAGAHRNLPHRPAFDARAEAFVLRPGDGAHFPVQAPHWVENGDEVSISFSVTFRSRASHRQRKVRVMNAMLRRAGASPRPAGLHPRRDGAKALAYDLLDRPVRIVKHNGAIRRLLLQR